MASYIDNIITCQRPTDNYKILKLLNRHVQTFSYLSEECKKRMSIQLPTASHKTDRNSVSSRYHYISAWNKKTQRCMEINPKANDMKEGEDISFDQSLFELSLTEENYVLAVSSSLHATAVFLKRNPNESRINNHNPACLSAWRANMDIQFVLDVYACGVYGELYIKGSKRNEQTFMTGSYRGKRRGLWYKTVSQTHWK